MATARDRKSMTQILELYHKDFPHLWDKTHSMYNNKNMRNDAYKVLTQIYRENFDIDASVDTLKKKLENMRTTYFRELKKVKESIRSGSGDIYEPSLWYFNQLNFLSDLYEPGGRYTSEPSGSITATDPLKTELQDTTFENTSDENDYEPSTSQESISKKKEYKRKQSITVFKKQENATPVSTPVAMKNEDWEVMGRSIGLQLRDINSKQLTIASKLISDTIYFAKLNRLSEDSHVEIGTPTVQALCSMCAAEVGD